MAKGSSIDTARKFFEEVWQSPPNLEALDDLVVEDFVFISGGHPSEGREALKK
jgi:hypothetical protein